ncbi:MAG: metallophosphoesterase [Lachnospiraceae bacterium]|nr:metallophosphoesterase [Lachnospiraceae bacterium]
MKKYTTVQYKVNMIRPDIAPGRLRLAFLTDLHNCENAPKNQQILDDIREADPDLILCGGDMLVGSLNTPFEAAVELLTTLVQEYPLYHALGNHESRLMRYPHQYGLMYQDYTETLMEAGVLFLDNQSELICIKGIPLQVAGLTLPQRFYRRIARDKLRAEDILDDLGEPNPKALNILLAHHPYHMEAYRNWGADLTLCGHYHGGMVRFGKHTGLLAPDVRFLDEHCHGLFDFHARITEGQVVGYDSHVVVSAGLGEHSLPIRFHNPRELVFVDLELSRK